LLSSRLPLCRRCGTRLIHDLPARHTLAAARLRNLFHHHREAYLLVRPGALVLFFSEILIGIFLPHGSPRFVPAEAPITEREFFASAIS
jgi:hypothetical protein